MSRIDRDEIERIKTAVPIRRLVESAGVELKRRGQDLAGLCPMHDDTDPSLVVSPDKGLWHCLGACGVGGSAIDWLMNAEDLGFREALDRLREMAGEAPPPRVASGAGAVRKTRSAPASPTGDAEDRRLLDRVVTLYHEALVASPEALAYLEGRGLADEEAIVRFRLGFADRSLGARLPSRRSRSGEEIRERLKRLGVLRDSGHEHLAGCIVVPMLDASGAVAGLYGRRLSTGARSGSNRHLYLPGPRRGVFNASALSLSREAILCESLLDALTLWCAGFRNVTAAYGTNGLTDDVRLALRHAGVERVLLAHDADPAGDKAAGEAARRLAADGIGCFRVRLPRGMDVNEYACSVRPADKALSLALRQSEWLGEGTAPAIVTGAPRGSSPQSGASADAAGEAQADKAADERTDGVPDAELSGDEEPRAEAEGQQTPSSSAALRQPSPSPLTSAAPDPGVSVEVQGRQATVRIGDRRWRVRGLERNAGFDVLRVNLLVARGDRFHVDMLDLYSARQRSGYVRAASEEIGTKAEVVRRDLGRVLLAVERLRDARLEKAAGEGAGEGTGSQQDADPAKAMSEARRKAAMALLRDPDLIERILADLDGCGLVGERTNKLMAYLAATSRKLTRPLAIAVRSASAAGKSSLIDGVLQLMPPEDVASWSALTGRSLFYVGEGRLKGKVLSVAEEAGAQDATYALKLLQSEGELTIASAGRDPATGKMTTQEHRVQGPVALMLTTTAADIDDELENRCVVLTVDEGRGQTRAIHERQRQGRTLDGLVGRTRRERTVELHRDAQRLLRSLPVVNPFAERLTFVDDRTRTRRDHDKYLTLIDAIALLRQHQRPVRTVEVDGRTVPYVVAAAEDVALANELAHETLGRRLDDMPPQTLRLLSLVGAMVESLLGAKKGLRRSEVRFTRRDVRTHTAWGNTQLKVHLSRLEDLELLLVHGGGPGRRIVYELLWDGEDASEAHLPGLIDVSELSRVASTTNLSGLEGDRSGRGRGGVGPLSGGCRAPENGVPLNGHAVPAAIVAAEAGRDGSGARP